MMTERKINSSKSNGTMAKKTRIEAGRKSWETRKQREANEKYSEAGNKAWQKINDNQFEPAKVAYLKKLSERAKPDSCIICGDSRLIVLQNHHANRDKTIEVQLCANCHDIVRRGVLQDLQRAHRWGCPAACWQRRIK